MKSGILIVMSSVLMLSSCMVATRPGGSVEIIPILPVVVELGEEPYYEQQGYHYYYSNQRWQYSSTRNGPWRELPRSHWPRETRHRSGNQGEHQRGDRQH